MTKSITVKMVIKVPETATAGEISAEIRSRLDPLEWIEIEGIKLFYTGQFKSGERIRLDQTRKSSMKCDFVGSVK